MAKARKRKSSFIYVSELKKYAKGKNVKVSQKFVDELNKAVTKILDISIEKCNKMKNKTLLPKHLPKVEQFDAVVKEFEGFKKKVDKLLK